MAMLTLHLTVESELMGDVVLALERMAEALPKRHGAPFRRLDRWIWQILEGEVAIDQPTLQPLGDGRFVVIPPKQLLQLVQAGQQLGII